MPKPKKTTEHEQVMADLKMLAARVNPVMIEHCDAWAVLGVKAGQTGVSLNVLVMPTTELQERVENEILAMAASIVKGRLPKNAT